MSVTIVSVTLAALAADAAADDDNQD